MNILQNENLIIESMNSGAELTRIYSKKNKKDILWCGDDKYWGRRSPILFPIVGKLKDNKTIIEGDTYIMNQHGFARDMDFEVLEITDNSVSYILISNGKTKAYYPYSFNLIVRYILTKSSVVIEWEVENIDNKDIYFSIGAHPAFNIPMNDNKSIHNYSLKFKYRDKVGNISLNGPYHDQTKNVDSLDIIDLKPSLFSNDALIYTNIDEITILENKENEILKVELKDFPLVGIWSPYYEDDSIAPFICIEPWYGLADNINSDYQYSNKAYINKLKINEKFKTSYKISVL